MLLPALELVDLLLRQSPLLRPGVEVRLHGIVELYQPEVVFIGIEQRGEFSQAVRGSDLFGRLQSLWRRIGRQRSRMHHDLAAGSYQLANRVVQVVDGEEASDRFAILTTGGDRQSQTILMDRSIICFYLVMMKASCEIVSPQQCVVELSRGRGVLGGHTAGNQL